MIVLHQLEQAGRYGANVVLTADELSALTDVVRLGADLDSRTASPVPGHDDCDLCGRRRRFATALGRFDLAEPESSKELRQAS